MGVRGGTIGGGTATRDQLLVTVLVPHSLVALGKRRAGGLSFCIRMINKRQI